jgi:lysophospholipase
LIEPVTTSFRVKTLIAPDKRQLRAGLWDLPQDTEPRGICLLLHGLTEFLEKYGETADELRARGFLVVSFDWRSQGASERYRSGNRAGHVRNFDEYDIDLDSAFAFAVEPIQKERAAHGLAPLPVIVLAHSMGAHILLRFLQERPRRVAAAVMTAPMLGIQTGDYSPQYTTWVTFLLNLRRPSSRLIFAVEDRDPIKLAFEDNQVTSDRARYERNRAYITAQPFLRIYGPTFGWLGAAFQSIRRMHQSGFAEAISTPLLIIGAGRDRLVINAAARDFAKRLPNATYVEIEDSEHEILMENDSIRARFWSEFDPFVNARLNEPVRAFGR